MIVNKAAFLLKEIPQFHPASEEYLLFWREEKKRCIETVRAKHIGMFAVKKNRFKYYKNGKKEKS